MIVVVDKNGNIKMKVTSVVVSASSSSPTSAQFASVVQHISAISAEVATKNDIITLQNAGSNFVSNPTAINFRGTGVSSHLSAGVAIVDITAGGGGGSVTSAEYISLVDRVSSNSAQMTSADNAISNAVSIVSAAQAVTSADLTSVKGVVSVLSQAVSVISVALSVLSARVATNSAQMTSADTALYQAVSVVSQQVSVLSARVDSNSAQMTSADNAISNAVSIVSVAQAATSAAVTSVNNVISALGIVGNTVFVSKDGNDGTGAREKFNFPFLTIQAAVTAATSGDTVIVFPGTYDETVTFKNGVNFYLYDGVTVSRTDGSAAFKDGGVAVTCDIDGYGLFTTTGSAVNESTFLFTNTGSVVTIRGKKITGSRRGIEALGTLRVFIDIDTTAGVEGIRMNGGLCNLYYRGDVTITGAGATGGYAIMCSSSVDYQNTADIKGNLRSNGNSPLAVYGAVVKFEGTTLSSDYFGLEIAGGRFFARNSTFESTSNVSGDGHAFVEYGVDDGSNSTIQFDNCQFIAGPNSDSINKLSGASGQQISFLTPCYANRPIDTTGAVPNIVWGLENLNILTENIGHAQLNLSAKLMPDQMAQGALTSGFIVGAVGSVPTWVSAGTIVSVTSAEHVSLADRVSAVSADLTSFKQSLNNIGDVSVPAPSDGQALIFSSAAQQWIAQSVAAGSGSVTSAEYLSLVDRVSVNSAQMTSADNAISNAVSIVSVAQAATSAAVTSVNQIVSVISQQVSVLSARVAANSAQMTSADDAISQAVSVVSAAQAVTSAAVTSVNNRVSAISTDVTSIRSVVSSLSTRLSALSTQVTNNSAQMTSADNAISQAVSIVSVAQAATSAAVTSVNNRISAVSADLTSFKQSLNNIGDVSVPAPSDGQALIFSSAAAQWIAQSVAAGSGSVTSSEYLSLVDRVSVNSAQMTSADNAISNAVSIVSVAQAATSAAVTSVNQVISALSARVAANSAQMTSADNNLASIVSTLVNKPYSNMNYVFNSATTIDDPGAGIIRFNNTNQALATEIAVNTTDNSGNDFKNWWTRIASYNQAIRGVLTLSKVSDPNVLREILIIGDLVDNGTWIQVSVSSQSTNGVLTSADRVYLTFHPADPNVSATQAAITSINQAVSVISNAVSIVSAAQAITSAAVTSVNNRVSSVSADLTSFKQSINNFVDVSIASPADQQVLVYNSAAGQWLNSTLPGGSGSVTSAEYTSLVDRVSVNSAQMTSADNAISNAVSIVSVAQAATSAAVTSVNDRVSAISTDVTSIRSVVSSLSTRLSALSTQVTNNSAQMTSADNAISQAVSVVSVAQAATSAAVTSVNNRISAISADLTSVQARVSANSAQMTSADNAISNAVSIVSAAQAVTSAAVTSVNNRISAVSADLTSFKQSINNFGDVSIASPADQQVLVYNSAAGQWLNSTLPGGSGSVTSAEYVSLVSIVSAIRYPAIESVTSAVYSVVDADNGKVKYFNNAASIEVVLPNGLTSGFQAIIYRGVSAGPIRFSAATSVEAQGSALNDTRTAATIINRGSDLWIALGAFLPAELGDVVNRVSVLSNAVSVLSQNVSVLSQAVSVLSQNVSVLSAAVAALSPPTRAVLAANASCVNAALANVSGLSVTVSAGGIYQFQGYMIVNRPNASNGTGYGLTFPAMAAARGTMTTNILSGLVSIWTFDGDSASGSTIASVGSVAALSVVVRMDGIFHASATGVIQMQAKTSATTSAPLVFLAGSYMQVIRIN